LQQIGGLLFMMTGPLKVVPTFAALTSKLPASEKSAIARKAVFIAMIALSLAIFMGPVLMKSWGASQQAVSAAAGLLLAIASLQAILGTASAPAQEIGERSLAISPLAFPTLVPSYAVGVLVLFAANFSQTERQRDRQRDKERQRDERQRDRSFIKKSVDCLGTRDKGTGLLSRKALTAWKPR
jgi:small neutral amino acid transporter SnatA (MarC family)